MTYDNPYAPPQVHAVHQSADRQRRTGIPALLLVVGLVAYAWFTSTLYHSNPTSPDRQSSYLFMANLMFFAAGTVWTVFDRSVSASVALAGGIGQLIIMAAMLIIPIGRAKPVLLINLLIFAVFLVLMLFYAWRSHRRQQQSRTQQVLADSPPQTG